MRSTLITAILIGFCLIVNAQEPEKAPEKRKMAHLNADQVVTSFPQWLAALEEAAQIDMKQQQLLAQCAAKFNQAKEAFSAKDFSDMTTAQKDSVFKASVYTIGQECERIRGGLMQNSRDNVPENVMLFQQVMDKVLDHFKAKDGYDNIYPMATAEIAKPEIQNSIKHYGSKDITEPFIKVMKAHIEKSATLKQAATAAVK